MNTKTITTGVAALVSAAAILFIQQFGLPEPLPEWLGQDDPASADEATAAERPEGEIDISALDPDLAELTVAKEHRDGYDRKAFKHWVVIGDQGCDARHHILRRDAIGKPQIDPFRCFVVEGDWHSNYDDIEYSGAPADGIDIDHMIPLAEAWDSGAHAWDDEKRKKFANDPLNLLAVTASSNRSKGDKDPAEWLPPHEPYVCEYLDHWVAVKVEYDLSVDVAERDAIARELKGCR